MKNAGPVTRQATAASTRRASPGKTGVISGKVTGMKMDVMVSAMPEMCVSPVLLLMLTAPARGPAEDKCSLHMKIPLKPIAKH